jgi:hypothetical protein
MLDETDAKMIEPLFKWNPGIESIYLSYHCQSIAAQLSPLLSSCRHIKSMTLEGWDDAVAIHRVMMACRNVEVLDIRGPVDFYPDWRNERSVQALCTLIEMHPKIQCVHAGTFVLEEWMHATRLSRCAHNVAPISMPDYWYSLQAGLFYAVFGVLGTWAVYSSAITIMGWVCETTGVSKMVGAIVVLVAPMAYLTSFIAHDRLLRTRRGSWLVWFVKNYLMVRLRFSKRLRSAMPRDHGV